MTCSEQLPQPLELRRGGCGRGSVDHARVSPTVRRMSADAQLRSQDWKRLTAQLTAYAWKRTGRRSWQLAADLAQDAITQAFTTPEAWDPAKEPLLKNLARRVIGLASNDLRRRRNSFECALDEEIEDGLSAADTVGDGKATPDSRSTSSGTATRSASDSASDWPGTRWR